MAVSDNRPFYLNLLKIRLPVTGFVSILHRVSGLFMFLAIPFSVYLLDLSLQGTEGFNQAAEIINCSIVQFALLILLWSLIHHFFAGIRFLLTDFDIGVDKQPAIRFAWAVFVIESIVFLWVAMEVFL